MDTTNLLTPNADETMITRNPIKSENNSPEKKRKKTNWKIFEFILNNVIVPIDYQENVELNVFINFGFGSMCSKVKRKKSKQTYSTSCY